MRFALLTLAALALLPISAFAAEGAAQKRADIIAMRNSTLTRLFEEEAAAKSEIEKAEGYAVFASGGVSIIAVSAGYGSGVAHDNKSGQETYMEMASGGLGLGVGVKDYRLVFVFQTREAYDQFIDQGWDFGGTGDAAAKAGAEGGEASENAALMPGVKVYQMTESGLVAQVMLQGTKYWKDDELNKP
jgi:lipid-binding SYLF domain-containing protein